MDVETIVYITIELLIAVLSIVGNSLVCYVIIKSPNLRKKVMYRLVFSLAVADISVGLICIPFAILTKLGLPHSAPTLCITMISFVIVPTQISVFNLLSIAVERYFAIRHPRIHLRKLTQKRCHYVIAMTWIGCTIFGMLPAMGWNLLDEAKRTYATSPADSSTANGTMGVVNATMSAPVDELPVCLFMEVIDFDYLMFIFLGCMVPPFLICSVLYAIIFVSFLRATRGKPSSAAVRSKASAPSKGQTTNTGSSLPKQNESSNDEADFELKEMKTVKNKPMQIQTKRNNAGQKTSKQSQRTKIHVEDNFTTDESTTASATFTLDGKSSADELEGGSKETLDEGKKQHGDNIGNRETSDDDITNDPSPASPQDKSSSGAKRQTKRRQKEKRQKQRIREFKAAAVLCLIVLCFGICWFPLHILNAITW